MFKRLGQIIESKPVISAIILTAIVSAISVITYDFYRDWKDAAVPIINLSDIRISPESNKYFLKENDLIPTSIELMEYLRGDVRAKYFMGLQKVMTYKKYYNYLNLNKKNIVVFDSEKEHFMASLNKILQLLKIKNPTEKDKENFLILFGGIITILGGPLMFLSLQD